MEKLKIGILYLGLHNQLVEKYGEGEVISRKDFFRKLAQHNKVPRNLRPVVLAEMENKKLIQRVNRDYVKILAIDINLEEDCSKLFKLAGIY